MNNFANDDDDDVNAVRSSIIEFIKEHRRRPFGVLREVGVQAALKRFMDIELDEYKYVDAKIFNNFNGGYFENNTVSTDRVRLEARIFRKCMEGVAGKERTDIIIYNRSNVSIFRHPNGPGDIVYCSNTDSVLAAIEIKASPSHLLDEKIKYARDIARLLSLRRHGIAGFFVVLDKSSPLYGEFFKELNVIDWGLDERAEKPLFDIVMNGNSKNNNKNEWPSILISKNNPGNKIKCIEIWNASENEAKTDPKPFYAYYQTQPEPK